MTETSQKVMDTAPPSDDSPTITIQPPPSSSDTTFDCPHCEESYTDLSQEDFRDHVSLCQPAEADDDDDDEDDDKYTETSTLSPPPDSLNNIAEEIANLVSVIGNDLDAQGLLPPPGSHATPSNSDDGNATPRSKSEISKEINMEETEQDRSPKKDDEPPTKASLEPEQLELLAENETVTDDDSEAAAARSVRPYLDRNSIMTYYEHHNAKSRALAESGDSEETPALDADESSVGDPQESEGPNAPGTPKGEKRSENPRKRYPFPTFTPLENFENYLSDAIDMPYEKLYGRTSTITSTLTEYQAEWDEIDKEIYFYEENQKYELKKASEMAKALQDADQAVEDVTLIEILKSYPSELNLTRKEWLEWQANYLAEHPDEQKLLDLMNKLRDATFSKAFRKRQKALISQETKKELIDKPVAEVKLTKDEIELEKRKRGRLTDLVVFDDQNQADAYGFTYSASELSRGRQTLPNLRMSKSKQLNVNGRPNRNKSKAIIDESAQPSEATTPSEETPPLPSKRLRTKPKKLADGTDTASQAPILPTSIVAAPALPSPALPETSTSYSDMPIPIHPLPVQSTSRAPALLPPGAVVHLATIGTVKIDTNPMYYWMDGIRYFYLTHKRVGRPVKKKEDGEPSEKALFADQSMENSGAYPPVATNAPKKKRGGRKPKSNIAAPITTMPILPAPILPNSIVPTPVQTSASISQPRNKGGRPPKHGLPDSDALGGLPAPKKIKIVSRGMNSALPVKRDDVADIQDFEGTAVLPSTEHEDTSPENSRPSTSSSYNTATTIDSIYGARRATTRERSKAPTSSNPTSAGGGRKSGHGGGSKKKRDNADEQTVVVDTLQIDHVPSKKKHKQMPMVDGANGDYFTGSQASSHTSQAAKPKRKRNPKKLGSSIEVETPLEGSDYIEEHHDFGPSVKKQKAPPVRRIKFEAPKLGPAKKIKTDNPKAARGKREPREGEQVFDEELDRLAEEEYQRTERENQAMGSAIRVGPPPAHAQMTFVPYAAPNTIASSSNAERPQPKRIAPKKPRKQALPRSAPKLLTLAPAPPTPVLPPSRSGRARKPTTKFMGMDGAADSAEDELDDAFSDDGLNRDSNNVSEGASPYRSEYEQYQALTQPGSPVRLGKRVRRPMLDLKAAIGTSDEEEDSEF